MLAGVFLGPSLHAADLRLQASLEPAPAGLDEEITFQIFIYDLAGRGVASSRPIVDFELDNLEVVRGPERRRGDRLRRQGLPTGVDAWVWTLRPQRIGKARVRKIRVRLGSRTFELPSQYIDILVDPPPRAGVRPRTLPRRSAVPPPPQPPPPATRSTPKVRLRATFTPSRPWIGQQVRYRLYLDYQSNVSGISPKALPDFQGFWVETMTVGSRPARDIDEKGELYNRAILLQRALFPLQAGEIELDAAEAQMNVQMPPAVANGRRTGSSRTGSSRTDNSSAAAQEQVRRRSNPLTLQVRELPPLPESIEGTLLTELQAAGVQLPDELPHTLVGELNLDATLEPAQIAVGDSAIWTLSARGDGHLQLMTAPPFTLPEGLQALPPQQQSQREVERDVVWQTQSWRYVLVARQEGEFVLPALQVIYFDPDKKAYRLASTPAQTLTVTAGAPNSATEPSATGGAGADTGTETTRDGDSSGSWWTSWWWVIVVAIALVFALLTRRAEITGYLQRRRQHRHQVDQLAQDLQTAFHVRAPRRAVEQAEAAWDRFLVARVLVPKDTPSAEWLRFLRHRKVPEATVVQFEQLLEDIRHRRHLPKLADVETMVEELVQRSREIARRM